MEGAEAVCAARGPTPAPHLPIYCRRSSRRLAVEARKLSWTKSGGTLVRESRSEPVPSSPSALDRQFDLYLQLQIDIPHVHGGGICGGDGAVLTWW